MKTGREILDFIGDDARVASVLSVSRTRVDRARRDPLLPASWLDGLERLAQRPLERKAFAFKGVRSD